MEGCKLVIFLLFTVCGKLVITDRKTKVLHRVAFWLHSILLCYTTCSFDVQNLFSEDRSSVSLVHMDARMSTRPVNQVELSFIRAQR